MNNIIIYCMYAAKQHLIRLFYLLIINCSKFVNGGTIPIITCIIHVIITVNLSYKWMCLCHIGDLFLGVKIWLIFVVGIFNCKFLSPQ